ncbi:HAMP domain-containing protein [Nocardioides terrae]|uniref:histidine kinase n=1 Tax=Nocardioides terrae TaxID=574651 RepID=A0A1I1LG62_9ACTN|nr:sensor histidine kinase [Nocardioides terrae]SFC68500.1 HAMP domain-containing protein [Nocardioides terrae]
MTGPSAEAPDRRRGDPRMTVQGWFLLVLAVMSVLVALGTAVGSQMLHRTQVASDRLVQRVQPAQAEAYRLQAALIDQETGARGYALTVDRQFLQPYTQGHDDEKASAARLRGLLSGDADLLVDLRRIEDAAAAWRRDYADPLVAGATADRRQELDRAAATEAKGAFDRIRRLFDAQNAGLAEARDAGVADLGHARAVRNGVLTGLVGLFFVTTIGMTLLLWLLVIRPLAILSGSTRQIAGGDFDHPISRNGPRDIRAVASDVDSMRHRIMDELGSSRELAADLDAQALELRRSNAELEQFAYVASHDLQEPLRKVASFCQLLEKRYGDSLDERGQQYIDFAVDGAKRMQVLITDLLTFSRVGRVNDTDEPVGLDPTLDKALVNLASAVEESGAVLERPGELPVVDGDPTLLVMLWQNLVGNAIKFRVPERPSVITVDCVPDPDAPDDGWLLTVTDNGIGIPPEFAEKVFVIFQRLHGRDSYSGTGIGLSLCKKIVDHHGGRIWIDTTYAAGTRICFTLPAHSVAGRGDRSAVPLEEGSNA